MKDISNNIKNKLYIIGATIFVIICIVAGIAVYQYIKNSKRLPAGDMSFAIYEVYHKEYSILANDVVIPIQAGRALKRDFGLTLEDKMIGDDTGDNISDKNERYAELTALYWMWKNAPKVDFIGLMHYRRHFLNEFRAPYCPSPQDELCKLGLEKQYLEQLMSKYDIIVARKSWIGYPVWQHYASAHHLKDLQLAIDYIKKHYPEMSIAIDNAINVAYFNNANMFIMRQELFNEYAKWLFEILFAIDDDLSHDKEGYNVRTPGFLAERLFNIWIEYRRTEYRIGEMPLMVY